MAVDFSKSFNVGGNLSFLEEIYHAVGEGNPNDIKISTTVPTGSQYTNTLTGRVYVKRADPNVWVSLDAPYHFEEKGSYIPITITGIQEDNEYELKVRSCISLNFYGVDIYLYKGNVLLPFNYKGCSYSRSRSGQQCSIQLFPGVYTLIPKDSGYLQLQITGYTGYSAALASKEIDADEALDTEVFSWVGSSGDTEGESR